MRFLLAALLAAGSLTAADKPLVSHATMQAVEREFDNRIDHLNLISPFLLLGLTRGTYLDRYGVVFSSEVNLLPAAVTPFRPAFTKAEIENLRSKKVERLPQLRLAIQEMLVRSATALSTLPLDEQIVVSVDIFYFSWEDTRGLPVQILMQGTRRKLLEFTATRSESDLADAITVHEY